MSQHSLLKIGISIGDLNGIGSEVVLRSLDRLKLFDFVPIIYANFELIAELQETFGTHLNIAKWDVQSTLEQHTVYVIDVWPEQVPIVYGAIDAMVGQYAFKSLKAGTSALKIGEIDVLLTAPIHKASIMSKEFPFPGHTNYLSRELNGTSLMLLVSDNLRVGLLTDHVPLDQVTSVISEKLIFEKARTMKHSLQQDFGIEHPKIALLGVDPHAGDEGAIGSIDKDLLSPCVVKLQSLGIHIEGPFAADGFFGSGLYKDFDGILASYHDQGLVPFKLLSFGNGVNFTAGLNKVRVSPDHGTAFDIAGQGTASISSCLKAFEVGVVIFNKRQQTIA